MSAENDDILDFLSPGGSVADSEPAGLPGHGRTNLAVRVLLLAVAVGVTFGGGGLLLWRLTNGGLGASTTRAVHAYLIDLKDANYSEAYAQLCSPQEPLKSYSTRLADARSRGHGITSFRLNSAFSKETFNLRSATGKVTFADGSVESVSYDIEPATSSGPACLDADDSFSS